MNRTTIRRNIVLLSIVLYLGVYVAIVSMCPTFLYKDDGTLREFGVGYRNKTVIPGWLLAMILAIVSYFSVMYYIAIPKIDGF